MVCKGEAAKNLLRIGIVVVTAGFRITETLRGMRTLTG
jgi:hypothetical protein